MMLVRLNGDGSMRVKVIVVRIVCVVVMLLILFMKF